MESVPATRVIRHRRFREESRRRVLSSIPYRVSSSTWNREDLERDRRVVVDRPTNVFSSIDPDLLRRVPLLLLLRRVKIERRRRFLDLGSEVEIVDLGRQLRLISKSVEDVVDVKEGVGGVSNHFLEVENDEFRLGWKICC